jgi:hypothetical protein
MVRAIIDAQDLGVVMATHAGMPVEEQITIIQDDDDDDQFIQA